METELITALNNIGDNGLWAIFWYSLFGNAADFILSVALIIGIRTLWKRFIEYELREKT